MVHIKCLDSMSGEYRRQIFAAIAANLISLAHGAALGWLSPMLLILQSSESPLDSGQITVSEASWLGSIFSVGGICGNLALGVIANTFGRKRALCFLTFPQMAFWLFVIFGYHINFLYAARICAGFAGGGTFVGIPLFISEIADKKIRGSLGSMLFLSVNIGTLLGFIIGAYLPYHIVPRIFIALPITFFITVLFLPETPQFLLTSGKDEDAKKSLAYYRNLRPEQKESQLKLTAIFKEANDNINNSSAKTKLSFADFKIPENRKAMLQGLGLVTIYILSGGFAIITYAASIFKEIGANFDPNTSAIIVGVNQILGTYVSTLIVDRVPRKMMLAISTCGAALGSGVTGVYTILSQYYDLTQVNWIPVASLSFAIFISSAGFIPLTFVVLGEILPQKLRALGSSFCNIFLNILSFNMLKVFPVLVLQIGIHGVMWIFAGICLLGLVFVIVCLPETKGKSI